MGYDVCFHPISPEEMREWYFTPLEWMRQGQKEKVLAHAAQYGINDWSTKQYLYVLETGASIQDHESFDKTHGFFIAVIQGLFRDYYCTRGSGFSFLLEKKPEYGRYFTPWSKLTPTAFPNPAKNAFFENYCSGVYLSPTQVQELLSDIERDPKVKEDLFSIWKERQFPLLIKALTVSIQQNTGLLEATDSSWYSSKEHCIDEYSK